MKSLSARLKSCPDSCHSRIRGFSASRESRALAQSACHPSFSAACEVVPWHRSFASRVFQQPVQSCPDALTPGNLVRRSSPESCIDKLAQVGHAERLAVEAGCSLLSPPFVLQADAMRRRAARQTGRPSAGGTSSFKSSGWWLVASCPHLSRPTSRREVCGGCVAERAAKCFVLRDFSR